MAAVIVRHKVRDYDAWYPLFIEHGDVRRRYGALSHQVFRVSEDPNDLIIVNIFKDMASARAFAQDPSLREAMDRGGVVSAPDIAFCEQADVAEYTAALA